MLDRVRERTPFQTPEKKGDIRGDLIIARIPRAVASKPQPADILNRTTSEPSRPAPNFAASLTAYLPVVTLFMLFARDRFVRMNAVQALTIYMLYAAAAVCTALIIIHKPSKLPPVSSEPWHALLDFASIVGYCLATALFLFCIRQLSRLKQPKIFALTRAAAFIVGQTRHPRHNSNDPI